MKHIGVALAAALACGTPALAQDKSVEWRFAHWVPASHPMHPAAEAWAASIEKASGGTMPEPDALPGGWLKISSTRMVPMAMCAPQRSSPLTLR